MSPRSFPAAIVMITVLALSLPAALGATPTLPRVGPGHPSALTASVVATGARFLHWALDLLDPAAGHGRWKALAGDAGCEMDPDGRTHPPSAVGRP
jgi:hypothetical protein